MKLAGGLFKPEINDGPDASYSIFELYRHFYEGNAVNFELISEFTPHFDFNKNRTISSKSSFVRKVQFEKH